MYSMPFYHLTWNGIVIEPACCILFLDVDAGGNCVSSRGRNRGWKIAGGSTSIK